MPNHLNDIEEIAHEFAIAGEFVTGVEVHSGHINSTYIVEFKISRKRQSLDRVNLVKKLDYCNSEMQAFVQRLANVNRSVGGRKLELAASFCNVCGEV
jgi:hypothetical protein